MALSQVTKIKSNNIAKIGPFLNNINSVIPTMQVTIALKNSENAKIRYAVCECIGEISKEMAPNF